jgi:NAD(P)-dependent dehydrogenase (short-subunit alcohol dehydrogenase family)
MGRLAGKVAVITGANSGIGLETAKRFVEEGAQVVITGRRKDELDKAAAEIGENVVAVQGDVSHLEDLDRLYAEVKAKFGHIDILFANAGLGQVAPLGAVTEEHFDREFDVNVKGLFFSVQKALPLFKDGGSIILNSSVAGHKGIGGFSVYSATKAAVRSFARSWTSDLKDRKIRVNAISPGPIETPIFGKMGLTEEQSAEFANLIISSVPLGRVGQSEEVAAAATFLASNESSYITGIDLSVDGGQGQV